jgi:hypothetical protein
LIRNFGKFISHCAELQYSTQWHMSRNFRSLNFPNSSCAICSAFLVLLLGRTLTEGLRSSTSGLSASCCCFCPTPLLSVGGHFLLFATEDVYLDSDVISRVLCTQELTLLPYLQLCGKRGAIGHNRTADRTEPDKLGTRRRIGR